MKKGEITAGQTVSISYGNVMSIPTCAARGTYTQLRAVRLDPTVSLARGLLISSIQAGSWNIEADEDVPEDVVEYMEHLLKLRDGLIYNSVAYGRVDYGWMPFEKIFSVDERGKIILTRLKPLLHDITRILVTPQGHFNGYRQNPLSGTPLDVEVDKCLHVAFGVEAGNLYGMPLLENVRAAMTSWTDCDAGASRYDAKVAGSHWVVHYPPGTGTVDGESVSNSEIAALILEAMVSSGSVAIPTTTAEVIQELSNVTVADLYAWNVELIEDGGDKQSSFTNRLNYLDKQKVRGLGVPERSVLEGEHGTKAEAGEHGDAAILSFEQIDRAIATAVNEQVVNQLLELNYGKSWIGKVRIVALPLVDTQVEFLRKLYLEIRDQNLDVETLADRLDLPQTPNGNPLPEKTPIEDKPNEDSN